jgi:hypothetical protein
MVSSRASGRPPRRVSSFVITQPPWLRAVVAGDPLVASWAAVYSAFHRWRSATVRSSKTGRGGMSRSLGAGSSHRFGPSCTAWIGWMPACSSSCRTHIAALAGPARSRPLVVAAHPINPWTILGAASVLVSCHSDGSWPGPGTTFTWSAGTGSWHCWQVSPARSAPPHTVCCATRGGPSDPARCSSPHCMRASTGTNS